MWLKRDTDRVKWAEEKLKAARQRLARATEFDERLEAEKQERKAERVYGAMLLRRDKLERPEIYKK